MKTPTKILEDFNNDSHHIYEDRIKIALASLRELVLAKKKEYLEEGCGYDREKSPIGYDYKVDGYNQALDDIANLFGGEG